MEKIINFQINSSVDIVMKLPCQQNELSLRDDVEIALRYQGKGYLLYSNDCIFWALNCFQASLSDAISSKLDIRNFSHKDIGYLWNENLHSVQTIIDEKLQQQEDWSNNYLIWNFKEYALWIYNKDNKIYLEATPVYPWHSCVPEKGDTFIPYDEWIKNYKLIAIVEITREKAEQLLVQAEGIINLIKQYEQKLEFNSDPKDGQTALDNSIMLPNKGTFLEGKCRIGISEGEYVVFTKANNDISNGHARPWNNLDPEIKRALILAGLADTKGNILS